MNENNKKSPDLAHLKKAIVFGSCAFGQSESQRKLIDVFVAAFIQSMLILLPLHIGLL